MAEGGMAHEEIWDDSALIDSWNDALEEYKAYHSITAKGEQIEDVIKRFQNSETVEYDPMQSVSLEDLPLDDGGGSFSKAGHQHLNSTQSLPGGEPRANEAEDNAVRLDTNTSKDMSPSATVPQALLDGVNDANLKNLIMSWYYAGYYTGLQEGQQKASSG